MPRRAFLKAAGAAGAAGAALPWWSSGAALARLPAATTLRRTLVRGAATSAGTTGALYYRLIPGPGEPHLRRMDLITSGAAGLRRYDRADRRTLVSFVHLTNARITDAQSPARVEFLQRYATAHGSPFGGSFRPHELGSTHALDAAIRSIRALRVGPAAGGPIAFAISTGDNVENAQLNELRWFIDAMDGRATIVPDSGGAGYEGVMSAAWNDPAYWQPGGSADDYKQLYGFPAYPRLIERATAPFEATGLGIPWFQTIGGRDGLMHGVVPRNPLFDRMATGSTKVSALPSGTSPQDGYSPIALRVRALLADDATGSPAAFDASPTRTVTPDPRRHVLTRKEYIAEMLTTSGSPVGHGLTEDSLHQADGTITCYWHSDAYRHLRLIGLDTVDPGGGDAGSLGERQLRWLESRLEEVSSHYYDASGASVRTDNTDRYVILLSHHALHSLDKKEGAELDALQSEINDLPRHLADAVAALVHRFPNVIAWISGHAGANSVVPRHDPAGRTGGFWEVATGSISDWPCQSRVVEVVDNNNGTLSIYATMVDHAGPVLPRGGDPVLRVASISRELAANDVLGDYDGARGRVEDRNVELLIRAPFRRPHPAPAPGESELPGR